MLMVTDVASCSSIKMVVEFLYYAMVNMKIIKCKMALKLLKPTCKNKNSAEVDIAPASGKITKNVKYRPRAPG